jgi:hypothetical protein
MGLNEHAKKEDEKIAKFVKQKDINIKKHVKKLDK